MKSNILSAACLAVLIGAGASYAVGQQSTPPATNQPIPSESVPTTTGGWPTPEEVVARMSSKLNLTDDQGQDHSDHHGSANSDESTDGRYLGSPDAKGKKGKIDHVR